MMVLLFSMRAFWIWLVWAMAMLSALAEKPVTGQVFKCLPLLLDQQGNDATCPSLFDRDAYQFYLRQHPVKIHGLRVDVQWKASKAPGEDLIVRVELRGVLKDGSPSVRDFETPVTAGHFSHWTSFLLSGKDFDQFGNLAAWHATLWDGNRLLGEQQSFLWQK